MKVIKGMVMAMAATLAVPALADTQVTTFDNAGNPNGWSWGFGDAYPSTGGNPGWYLFTDGLDTFAPQPRPLNPTAPWVGDYRALGVTCIGVDLITHYVDFSAGGRPLTLMLIHDNDTPGDPFDDTAAYFMHRLNVPLVGDGWIFYDFTIPANQTTLPAGWVLLNLGDSGSPAIHTWNQVIQHVSRVQFFYGNPEFFFIFQQWSLGMDNVRICHTPAPLPCLGDVHPRPAGNQVVNIDDLVVVITNWGATGTPGTVLGDVNNNGVVNIDDLVALITNWGACP